MLELATSFDEIAKIGVFEAVNFWDDFVLPDRRDYYQAPVYSSTEQTALWETHAKWNRAANAIIEDSWDSAEISKIPEWIVLQKAAVETLAIFERRGRFSEDTAESFDT